jgi:DNA-binding NarL/FixJ family response regulator
MQRPRVLLADDHPMMLAGLSKLLEPECEIVGTLMEGGGLVEAAKRLRPDLVIVDISMPGLDGIEATRRLQAVLPDLRILILSFKTEASWVRAAFEAGACGYVTKTSAPDEIETAVREVLNGRFYVSPAVTRAVVGAAMQGVPGAGAPPAPRGPGLREPFTRREHDVMRLVGLGLGNKEIARRLGVSVTTVRTHLSKVYDKLGTASRVELALLAAQTGDAVM